MGKRIHESQRAHPLFIAFIDVMIAVGLVMLFMYALATLTGRL
jgi:hypothetical protein